MADMMVAYSASHGLGEEESQLINAVWRVSVLVGNGPADGGGMHSDLFSHFLDHHRAQVIHPMTQEGRLPPHDRLADAPNRLAPLLDVTQKLDRRVVSLFDVVTNVPVGAALL